MEFIFLLGKYTDIRRVKIFTPKNLQRGREDDNTSYFSNDFRNQDVCKYNFDNQLFTIKPARIRNLKSIKKNLKN